MFNCNKVSLLIVSVLILGSCSTTLESQVSESGFMIQGDKQKISKIIPELIVPEGQIAKEPPPKPNKTNVNPFNQAESDARNTVKNRDLRLAYSGVDGFPVKTPPFAPSFSVKQSAPNPNWGTTISQVSSPVGDKVAVFAAFELQSISFSAKTYEQLLYAPTLFPPNNSILESTLYYWRAASHTGTTTKWGVWSHNTGQFEYTEPTDATFKSKYVRTQSDGRQYFYSEVEKTSGTSHSWRAMLYNYNTGTWDVKYMETASSGGAYSTGWAIHEPKFFSGSPPTVNCPTLPSIKMKEVQVWNGSVWNNVNSTRGSLFDGGSTCSSWSFNMVNNYYEWVVN